MQGDVVRRVQNVLRGRRRAVRSLRPIRGRRAVRILQLVDGDCLPFDLETDLERQIAADPEWREGVEWGRARRGHPEGAVKLHIRDVLANVDREATSTDERRRLRLAALVHDAFKYRAREGSAPVGSPGHHGSHAATFLARFVDDDELVCVVKWHDEAFAAWLAAVQRRNRARGEQRVRALIDRLGPGALQLYTRFFRADNATEGKSPKSVEWFEDVVRRVTART